MEEEITPSETMWWWATDLLEIWVKQKRLQESLIKTKKPRGPRLPVKTKPKVCKAITASIRKLPRWKQLSLMSRATTPSPIRPPRDPALMSSLCDLHDRLVGDDPAIAVETEDFILGSTIFWSYSHLQALDSAINAIYESPSTLDLNLDRLASLEAVRDRIANRLMNLTRTRHLFRHPTRLHINRVQVAALGNNVNVFPGV